MLFELKCRIYNFILKYIIIILFYYNIMITTITRPRRIFYDIIKKKHYIIINKKKKYLKSLNENYIKKILKKYKKKFKVKKWKNINNKKKKINKFLTGEITWKIWASNFLENDLNKKIIQNLNDNINLKNDNNKFNLAIEEEKNELIPYKNEINNIDNILLNFWNKIIKIRDEGINKIKEIEEEKKNLIDDFNKKKIDEEKLNEKINNYNLIIDDYKKKNLSLSADLIDSNIKKIKKKEAKELLEKYNIPFEKNLKIKDLKKILIDEVEKIRLLRNVNENLIIEEEKGEGEGIKNLNDGLTIENINNIMSPFKLYIGTFLIDEFEIIEKIIIDNKFKKFGFILLNLNKNSKKIGHYIAIFCDSLWIEIFDPLGSNNLNNKIINKIKNLFEKIKLNYYLKLKINSVQFQSKLSASCGWFCIQFLIQRFNNIPFEIATKFNKIKKNEKNIEDLKKKYIKFGYI